MAEFLELNVSRIDAIRIALENRPDIKSLRHRIDAQKVTIVQAKNQALPLLDVVATYQSNGLNVTPHGAVEESGEYGTFNYGGQLAFEYPLGNSRARYNLMLEKSVKRHLVRQLQDSGRLDRSR